jgi:mycothiol synthase
MNMKKNDSLLDAQKPLEFIVRTANQTDVSGITQLIYAVCEAEGDTATAVTEEELRNEWAYEGFDPCEDAFVAENEAGNLLGYAAVFDVDRHCELSGDIYLHPSADVRATGTSLLEAMHRRAAAHVPLAPENEPVVLRVAVDNRNESIKALFPRLGYEAIRYHWRMEIELGQKPQLPELPHEIVLQPFDWQTHAQAVWQARNAAFRDNWGSRELDFEEFSYYTQEHPEYDPTLWQVAWDGDRVIGFCINHMRMGIGWVHILGVIPEWRGKGLGRCLLQEAFNTFYDRDIKVIGLGVDAANESGATALYKSVGMKPVSEFVTFEKRFLA